MADYDQHDWFNDMSIVDDPFPYYEHLRSHGPVAWLPGHNAVAVTGVDEAVSVFTNAETFSAVNALTGPLFMPFKPEGDDIDHLIEQHRPQMPLGGQIVTSDPPEHGPLRALLMRIFTPSRLKANEERLWAMSDRLIDEFVDDGRVELVHQYGVPFAGLVIAVLLGVPEEDRSLFRGRRMDGGERTIVTEETNPLAHMGEHFARYILERRAQPRGDILTEIATQTHPDGSLPSVEHVVTATTFLFAAGQDTTARLLSAAMSVLADRPDLQERLRADRSLIPDFIEEALRFDGAVKTVNRLVRKTTRLGGVELPAGTTVTLLLGAINRDPRKFEEPGEFRLGRPKVREHLAFGRGAHTCAGAPLARTETRVSLERFFDRFADIRISDEKHGAAGRRRFSHEPTYVLRGFRELHLEFTKA